MLVTFVFSPIVEKRSDLTDVKAVAVAVFVFRLRGAQTLVAGFLA
jgi:hypothetical protein